jgi:hypothetical protein
VDYETESLDLQCQKLHMIKPKFDPIVLFIGAIALAIAHEEPL